MLITFVARAATALFECIAGAQRFLAIKSQPFRDASYASSRDDAQEARASSISVQALEAETRSPDRWISRARPTFLYVIYAMILWALPMGLVAAISPATSHAITTGMTDYLSALPAELYTLFGTGYLGYATLRQWGKARGTDR